MDKKNNNRLFHATLEEALASLNAPFLNRQVRVKPRTVEEAFGIIKNAVALEKPVQMIISPRVDMACKAYYYIGVRFDREEVDFKLPVNAEIEDFIIRYMIGEDSLPEVQDLTPATVEAEDDWFAELDTRLKSFDVHGKEELEMTDKANYLKVVYKMRRGKITISKGKVESIVSLLNIA